MDDYREDDLSLLKAIGGIILFVVCGLALRGCAQGTPFQ